MTELDRIVRKCDPMQRQVVKRLMRDGCRRIEVPKIGAKHQQVFCVMSDGRRLVVEPSARLAPRTHQAALLGLAIVTGVLASNGLLDWSGVLGPSHALEFAAWLGFMIGIVISWPRRRPRKRTGHLEALAGAAAFFGMEAVLHHEEHHGDRGRTTKNLT